MRTWHFAAFLLIACGGKIATESTAGTSSGKPTRPIGDDDDDSPPISSSGVSSSGYHGTTTSGYSGSSSDCFGTTSGCYGGSTSGYSTSGYSTSGYPSSSSGYSTSSSGGTLCGSVSFGCGGTEQSYKCSVDGPPGTPGLQCYGAVGHPNAKCNCYGTYLDGGTSTFEVKIPKSPDSKDLFNIWQKYCGGYCY